MAKKTESEVEILELHTKRIAFNIIGETPLILNRFDEKAKQQLLLPPIQKNKAERVTTLKHDPIAEFRSRLYMNRVSEMPALFHLPSNGIHKAVGSAAVDIPGAAKAQMLRLTSVVTPNVNLFGVPMLFCRMVRSGGMNAAPDVRTRPIFPEWAITVEFQVVSSLVKESQLANLVAAAGQIVGLCDWRPQKGGAFGKFHLAGPDDKDFKRIVEKQSRAAQTEAFNSPAYYDVESEDLMNWFFQEASAREMKPTLLGELLQAAE